MIHSTEKLLRELIALPSVNPAFAPPGDPCAGEQRVCDFLTAISARAGLDVEQRPVHPGRSNLLAALLPPGGRGRQRVVFAPHMDTVGAANPKQFRPVKSGGRLYGRGACDTKGSLAMMLDALRAVARSKRRPQHTEVFLAALVDEECGQSGSRSLVHAGFKADLAIVGEPTQLRVVTAHKGDLWLELETRGLAAHGSKPHLGRNAVHLMARVVELLETDYAAALRPRRHSILGHPTINVGMISGGRQPNIVPDRCWIRIDRRTLPGENDNAVKREVVRFLRARGATVSLRDNKADEPAPPLETDPRHPLVKLLMAAGGQRAAAGVDFFTDAGVLAGAGIPSVVFGPGDIAQAHTADEWVEVRQLEQGRELLVKFLQNLP